MNQEELKYTEEHLWVHVEGANARFGISDHAQKELEEIVYVELPETGKKVRKGDIVCTIESVKSSNDLTCPASGEIHSINTQLRDEPEIINQDPLGAGWIFTLHLEDPKQLEALMDWAAYKRFLET
jgi:glycine cleavage system H protein